MEGWRSLSWAGTEEKGTDWSIRRGAACRYPLTAAAVVRHNAK